MHRSKNICESRAVLRFLDGLPSRRSYTCAGYSPSEALPMTIDGPDGPGDKQVGDPMSVAVREHARVARVTTDKAQSLHSLPVELTPQEDEPKNIGFNEKLASEVAEKACRKGVLRSASMRKPSMRKPRKRLQSDNSTDGNDSEKAYFTTWRNTVEGVTPESVGKVDPVTAELSNLAHTAERAVSVRRSLSRRASDRKKVRVKSRRAEAPVTPIDCDKPVLNLRQALLTVANLAALNQLEQENAARADQSLENGCSAIREEEVCGDAAVIQAALLDGSGPCGTPEAAPADGGSTGAERVLDPVSEHVSAHVPGSLQKSLSEPLLKPCVSESVMEPALEPMPDPEPGVVSTPVPEPEAESEHSITPSPKVSVVSSSSSRSSSQTVESTFSPDVPPLPTDDDRSSDEDSGAESSGKPVQTRKQLNTQRMPARSVSADDDALAVIAELEAEKTELEYLVESLRDRIEYLEMDIEDARAVSLQQKVELVTARGQLKKAESKANEAVAPCLKCPRHEKEISVLRALVDHLRSQDVRNPDGDEETKSHSEKVQQTRATVKKSNTKRRKKKR